MFGCERYFKLRKCMNNVFLWQGHMKPGCLETTSFKNSHTPFPTFVRPFYDSAMNLRAHIWCAWTLLPFVTNASSTCSYLQAEQHEAHVDTTLNNRKHSTAHDAQRLEPKLFRTKEVAALHTALKRCRAKTRKAKAEQHFSSITLIRERQTEDL